MQVSIAIGLFVLFWAWHLRVQPYSERYQNRIESLLYAFD